MVAYRAASYEARSNVEVVEGTAWLPRPHTVIAVFGTRTDGLAASALARTLPATVAVEVFPVATLRPPHERKASIVRRLGALLVDRGALINVLARDAEGVAVVVHGGDDRAVARRLAAAEGARAVYRAGAWTHEVLAPRGA